MSVPALTCTRAKDDVHERVKVQSYAVKSSCTTSRTNPVKRKGHHPGQTAFFGDERLECTRCPKDKLKKKLSTVFAQKSNCKLCSCTKS